MRSDRTVTLRQIRRRLTVIAVASVAAACFLGIPYLLIIASAVVAVMRTQDAWLWILLGGLILFSAVICLAIYASPPTRREPAESPRSQ